MGTEEQLPNSLSLAFVEDLYESYRSDPSSVSPDWRDYFHRLGFSQARATKTPSPNGAPIPSAESLLVGPPTNGANRLRDMEVQDRVDQWIRAIRLRGHTVAQVDPLGFERPESKEIKLETYGLTEADLDRRFSTDTIPGLTNPTLREIVTCLRNTYCRHIGAQFHHIDELEIRDWLQKRMESTQNRCELSLKEQLMILTRLTDAVYFEEFIQRKYVGAKSFSLEGAESLIPLLEMAIEKAGEQQINQIVFAMAHRGRLNVLANVMGKSPSLIFREFDDNDPDLYSSSGDVKYHLGFSCERKTACGQMIHLSLCFNPSHLEFVNPVALGRLRAKQDRSGDTDRTRGLAILIHGDAAFIGEGVSQETFNLSQLKGYRVGGVLHVIVNNQIGFTTPPEEGRSTRYCSDIGRMLQIPIFHVNGEDPEAVAQVVRLAMDFRERFKRDALIDMYCFRKHGHNESDEPSFTQPIMYDRINKRKPIREGYLDHLLRLGKINQEQADEIAIQLRQNLETQLSAARVGELKPRTQRTGAWNSYKGGPDSEQREVNTHVPKERLVQLLTRLTKLPDTFNPHRKIKPVLQSRLEAATGKPLDWATAESLAFATIATDGRRVRLSGQDCGRGTFSQRHAVLHDVTTGATYCPLQHLAPNQGPVEILNSPLSETGVLGFEYGYSLDCPSGLILWEAQFGDFVNVAQVIIDQFIASAEAKWRRLSGLVMLLPHGFEGQGPEHSSARLERFLTLAAEDNIQVCNPTTPAQYFHLLRRQVLRHWRKPLIVMTPKSLLRLPAATSSLDELATGRFERILGDQVKGREGKVVRVLLCTGKIYYDLEKQRESFKKKNEVAILRLEQLYPLPDAMIRTALAEYAPGTPVYWVQEEPENMGAWRYMRSRFGDKMFGKYPLHPVTRPASASPGTGSPSNHKFMQNEIVMEAFEGV